MGGSLYDGYFSLKAYRDYEKAAAVVENMQAWADKSPTLPEHYCDEDVDEFIKKEKEWKALCPYPEFLHKAYFVNYTLGQIECE